MTSYEFEVAAKNALIDLIRECLHEEYTIHDLHFVSFSHVLGNKKATLIDCGNNNRYYEVVYDNIHHAMYVDMYEKRINRKIDGNDLNFEVRR